MKSALELVRPALGKLRGDNAEAVRLVAAMLDTAREFGGGPFAQKAVCTPAELRSTARIARGYLDRGADPRAVAEYLIDLLNELAQAEPRE